MLVQIPVTKLTLKCLRFLYDEDIINVSVRSPLFQNLSKVTFSDNDGRAKKQCTEMVEMIVPKHLGKHIQMSNIWALGYMLHNYEIENMLNTIEFCVFHLKQEATTSLENYFSARKVDEDDLAISTAYKAWQRRQSKKIGKFEEFRITKTHKNVFDCSSLPFREIIKNLTVLYDTDFFKFRGSNLKEPKFVEQRKVILFLAYKLSDITIRDLGKEFLFRYPNVHKNIKATEFIYQNYEHDVITIMIDEAFEYLKGKVSPLNIEPLRLNLKHDGNRKYKKT